MSKIDSVAVGTPLQAETLPSNDGVQRVNPLDCVGWDTMVSACPSASFFHSAAWAKTLQTTYGFVPVYFIQIESGRLRSLLPVMEVNSWLTGRRGVSLPFTDDCEPLCSEAGSFPCLFQAAMKHGEARGWKYLECRGGRTLFASAPASTAFYGHRLGLSVGEAALFAKVEGAVRRAIRKAEKSMLSVEMSQSLDAVHAFYRLQCKTRKRHGLPPQPFRFFQNIFNHVLSQKQGFLFTAKYQQAPIAAAVFFHWEKKAIYKYGASDETFQQLRANNLVMWEAIKWYARNGFELLDFGRTSLTNEGLRRFKLGWGTEEHRIEYVRYDRQQSGFVNVKDESSGQHNRMFKVLPSFLSRLIGAALYKHAA